VRVEMGRDWAWKPEEELDEEAEDDGVAFDGATVARETASAILVLLDEEEYGDAEYWIPKSQILERSEVKGGIDTGTLVITRWLAEQKGLA
jgi:hypothetical protein